MELKLLGDGARRRKESGIFLTIGEIKWRDDEYEEKRVKGGNSV